MVLEDIFIDIALNSEMRTIILCDRGVMDGSAYTDDNLWQALLDETSWNTIQLRDRRYEAVIHMVTVQTERRSSIQERIMKRDTSQLKRPRDWTKS